MDTWDMPDWRRDDGTMMIWDPTSHTYVEGPTDGGDLAVDRGHASGGDNDLFDPAQGGDGEGHGNLFQPSNPDNNGWLDGKTAMAMGSDHWQQILETHPYFYHVTEANRIPSIQQHGLTPGSAVSEKTEGVWTEMGGIPARQGFLYLWASLEGAEHGAEWFLGIQNPATITIDATKLDPNLIEADEDYASSDPENFMAQHGGPTPDEYYGNTDEYDQGNWSGYTPDQVAAEAGSNWSVENPMLKDPGATWESYKGFGDRQDFHGRVAYGGPIPLEAILKIDAPRTAKTAEVAEAPTIAPAMPDLNYVLDYNPEDTNETGWFARIWSPNYQKGADQPIGGQSKKTYRDLHPTGVWDESFGTWQQCYDYLRQAWQNEDFYKHLDVAQPDEPFEWQWDGSNTNGANMSAIGFMFPVIAEITPVDSKTSKVAMPYHVSPQKNREKIEQEGLHTLDVNHAGTPQDGDGLYYWDTPEQAKFFGDTEYAPKPYDMWQFDLDHQFEQPETDEFFGDMTPEEANQYYGDGMDLFYNEDGTPGAHYIPGGHVSPDRIKRVGMAQQTGDPELDSLIAEFSQKYDKMRDPVNSEMSCQWMSWEFVNFLRERGIPASTGMSMDTNRTEPEPGDWHDDEFASLPEIGYDDAPIDNGMTHCVVYVPRDEATYMVDWTASQYGYSEFPMVQRMQGDPASGISFERNF